jgi:hypothetical protein
MSKMGSHDPFGHLKHKLWPKERSGVKPAIWFPITKSWELTQFPYVQVACDTLLESFRRGLQLRFRLHPNRRSTHKVRALQSCENSNFNAFRTPTWESWDKKSFGWRPCGEVQSILYGGRWWLPPSLSCDQSCESEVTCGSSYHPRCSNTVLINLLVGVV